MHYSDDWDAMRGVWGAARPPSGGRGAARAHIHDRRAASTAEGVRGSKRPHPRRSRRTVSVPLVLM